jgi:superfamily II DNA or RNA helicase
MTNRDKIQEEAISTILNHHRGTCAISMGVGKTLIGLMHMTIHYNGKNRFLVVAPKVSIFQSWKEDAVKFNKAYLLDCIDFTTYLSINKKDPAKYSVVYLDECHSLLYSHKYFLDNYKGKILGLTGTPPIRDYSEKAKMVNHYCPVRYTYKVDQAVSDNILNNYSIKVHMLQLSKAKDFKVALKTKGTFYTSEYDSYNYCTTRVSTAQMGTQAYQFAVIARMTAIKQYKTKEDYTANLLKSIDDKCIVFANTQKQADKICKASYHSKNPYSEKNLKKFKEGEINQLSCVDQLSEGVTIPDLKAGIIMHSYGNERKTNQRLGRMLRLNPDMVSEIHILCYKDTVDEKWLNDALSSIDPSKIEYIDTSKNLFNA